MAGKQESMGYKEKLRNFCSFILVERRQWSEQKVANSYSMSGKDSRARLFPVMANDRTRHSGHKLQGLDETLFREREVLHKKSHPGSCSFSILGDFEDVAGQIHS